MEMQSVKPVVTAHWLCTSYAKTQPANCVLPLRVCVCVYVCVWRHVHAHAVVALDLQTTRAQALQLAMRFRMGTRPLSDAKFNFSTVVRPDGDTCMEAAGFSGINLPTSAYHLPPAYIYHQCSAVPYCAVP